MILLLTLFLINIIHLVDMILLLTLFLINIIHLVDMILLLTLFANEHTCVHKHKHNFTHTSPHMYVYARRDPVLKSLLQWVAASEAGCNEILYCSYNH